MIIINAEVHTVSGEKIDNGFIDIKNGKIDSVGGNYAPRPGDDVFDACGLRVYPGFIDGHCHLGMWEDGIGLEGADGNEDTDPLTPHLQAIDAVNPMDECFRDARSAGVTAIVVGPGSTNPIGGGMLAMKTSGVRADDMALKNPAAIKMAFGENPKMTYHDKDQAPVTRMAIASLIREQLFKAKRYLEQMEKADGDSESPEYDMKCESLIPLLKGEMEAHIHAHRADDIFSAMRIAKEFGFKYTIVHCTQGAEIAEELSKESVKVLAGPLICDRSKPELKCHSPALPAILNRHGVKTAIITDHPELPVQYLALSAGLAVREGLPHDEAIKAITLYPAEISGISDRVGSIEDGKDADLVFFNDDPLLLSSKPVRVMINGEWVL